MLHLMNSAMMPQPGTYACKSLALGMVKEYFQNNIHDGWDGWESYIGYANSARILSELIGVEVPVSQEETVLTDGDCILAMRLTRRVADKSAKAGKKLGQNLSDYQFFAIQYQA